MTPSGDVEIRMAARVLVIDDRDRILLFGYRNPSTGEEFWATPGGGVEDGESDEQAARREVIEETGHEPPDELGPVIWIRELGYEWDGRHLRQREVFYFWRVASLDVDPSLETSHEVEGIIGHGWFTIDEIRSAVKFTVAPRRLADLVQDILENGLPSSPILLGT